MLPTLLVRVGFDRTGWHPVGDVTRREYGAATGSWYEYELRVRHRSLEERRQLRAWLLMLALPGVRSPHAAGFDRRQCVPDDFRLSQIRLEYGEFVGPVHTVKFVASRPKDLHPWAGGAARGDTWFSALVVDTQKPVVPDASYRRFA